MATVGFNPNLAQISELPEESYNNDTPSNRAIEPISTDVFTTASSATLQKISDRLEEFTKTASSTLLLQKISTLEALLDIRTLDMEQLSLTFQIAAPPLLRKVTNPQVALPISAQLLTAAAIISFTAYNLFCMRTLRTEQLLQERQATSQATATILQNYEELPPQFASLTRLATLMQQRSSAQTQEPFNPLDIVQAETALDAFEKDLKETLDKQGENITLAYTLFTPMQAAQQSLAKAQEHQENSKAKLIQMIQEVEKLRARLTQANTQ